MQIGHGACDRNLTAHAVEFDDLVVVGATHTPPDPGTICTMLYLLTPSTLQLAEPLGDRVVLDVVSGETLLLGVPPPGASCRSSGNRGSSTRWAGGISRGRISGARGREQEGGGSLSQ